jgi:hypothetical protein
MRFLRGFLLKKEKFCIALKDCFFYSSLNLLVKILNIEHEYTRTHKKIVVYNGLHRKNNIEGFGRTFVHDLDLPNSPDLNLNSFSQ